MIVSSLQIGQGSTYTYQGKPVETASFKMPVDGPLHLGRLGFTGDQQVDTVHHGGPDKAVLVYAQAHYPHWARFLGRAPGPAALGENLTVEGATEETVCIGDTYRLGGAVVQVSQPRVPCFKMNLRHGHPGVLAELIRTGYTGFYLRVLAEGPVQKGDRFTLLQRPAGAPSIAFANRIRHHDPSDQAGIHRLLNAEGLAAVWLPWLQRRLVIETERLRFRPYILDDLPFYTALVTDPRVMQFIGDGSTRTPEEAAQRLQGLIERFDPITKTGLMLLERKADGAPVGHAGLMPQVIEGQDELEIGYWLAPAFWGQGLAAEAATALRDHAWQHLKRTRLVCLIQHGNEASARVARKMGMTHERDVDFRGKRVRLFAMAKDEPETNR